jgi:hypothetical protein
MLRVDLIQHLPMRKCDRAACDAGDVVARFVDEAARLNVVRQQLSVVVAEREPSRVDELEARLVRERLAERVVGKVAAVAVIEKPVGRRREIR